MKKIIILIASLFMSFSLFAQNVKSAGVSDKDVKNYVKNFTTIQKEMDKYFADSYGSDLKPADYTKAESILEKNGIAGPNAVEKFAMITQCSALLIAEKEAGDQMAMLKSMGMDPLAAMRSRINQADCDVVSKNFDAIFKVMSEE